MKTVFTCLFSFFFVAAFAQTTYAEPPNSNFSILNEITCPFDTSNTSTVLWPDDWMIYHTLNDKYDGPIDSSYCISLDDNGFGLYIPIEQINIQKPVFVRSLMDSTNRVLLYPDLIYSAGGNIFGNDGDLNTTIDCANEICTGTIIGIEIPDSTGLSTNMRMYYGLDPIWTWNGDFTHGGCIPTEYFEENYLREFIYKITVDNSNFPDYIQLSNSIVATPEEQGQIDSIVVPQNQFQDTAYYAYPYQFSTNGGWNYLVMYGDTTYPSIEHRYFLDTHPQINTDTAVTINLFISYEESLIFQPFTQIRGALIEGSDSIRHTVNIINDGGNMCMDFIDVIFEQNTNYIHRDGNIHLSGKNACLMFRDNAKLIVADDATLNYGKKGRGILALRTGGTIELGKNSTLNIDNTLLLYRYKKTDSDPDKEIYMTLNSGSKLVFSEYAKLKAPYDTPGTMRLNIYMNGGELDDSHLSPAERLLINKIYPTPAVNMADNVQILPNPARDFFHINYLSEADEMVHIKVIDASGKTLLTQVFSGTKGLNNWQIPVQDLAIGTYFLEMKSSQGSATKRVILID